MMSDPSVQAGFTSDLSSSPAHHGSPPYLISDSTVGVPRGRGRCNHTQSLSFLMRYLYNNIIVIIIGDGSGDETI